MKINETITAEFNEKDIENLIREKLDSKGYILKNISFKLAKKQSNLGYQASMNLGSTLYNVFDKVVCDVEKKTGWEK